MSSEDPYENLKITTGAVAEPSTSQVNKTGSWRQFRPVIDQEACIGCGQCDTFCPDQAAKPVGDGDTYGIDLDYCKGCGICAKECPVDAIEMVREEA
jgi:pyruvate ferredoxin oxidoreductase delta subunit